MKKIEYVSPVADVMEIDSLSMIAGSNTVYIDDLPTIEQGDDKGSGSVNAKGNDSVTE